MGDVKTKVEVRIRLVEQKGDSNLLAFASFVVDVPLMGAFAFNHIRILTSQNGPFVSLPAQKKGEGNEAKWYDHFHPITADGRKALTEMIIGEYEKALASKN